MPNNPTAAPLWELLRAVPKDMISVNGFGPDCIQKSSVGKLCHQADRLLEAMARASDSYRNMDEWQQVLDDHFREAGRKPSRYPAPVQQQPANERFVELPAGLCEMLATPIESDRSKHNRESEIYASLEQPLIAWYRSRGCSDDEAQAQMESHVHELFSLKPARFSDGDVERAVQKLTILELGPAYSGAEMQDHHSKAEIRLIVSTVVDALTSSGSQQKDNGDE